MLTPLGNSTILNDLQNTNKSKLSPNPKLSASGNVYKAELRSYSSVYINADYLINSEVVNRQIDLALEAGKILMVENTRHIGRDAFESLPFMAKGDLVIFIPGKSGDADRVIVYGGSSYGLEQTSTAQSKGTGTRDWFDMPIPQALEQTPNFYAYDTYQKRSATREHILSTLKQFKDYQNSDSLSDEKMAVAPLNNQTGGSIGYQCPPQAKQERLCWSAIVTNIPYRHTNGNADINVLHHFSVAQYRTDTLTAIAVSTHGSANPNMKVDHSSHRAYYLGKVETSIDVTSSDGMQLWSRNPSNRVNDVSVSSTSGMSFGIDATASDKPSLGAKISYDESQSIRVNLRDWEANTSSPDGIDAKWIFQLNYPKSISDWVTQKSFKKAKFRDVPGISKFGLQYTTEGVWVGGPEKQGHFEVNLTTKVSNYQLFFTKNTIVRWSARREGWVHTLRDGSYWFNNNWLKRL